MMGKIGVGRQLGLRRVGKSCSWEELRLRRVELRFGFELGLGRVGDEYGVELGLGRVGIMDVKSWCWGSS